MPSARKADVCKTCPVGGHRNEVDRTCSVLDPRDGLPLACVGDWVDEKHARVRRYVDISRAVRRQFLNGGGGATYIDLFCGPGRARIRQTQRIVDGSALVAANEGLRTGAPFTEFFVADLNPAFVEATVARLNAVGVGAHSFVGPAAETVETVAAALPRYALNFALLDPYDLGTLPFTVIQQLAGVARIDILIHVSLQDLQRNLARYLDAPHSPLDLFAPGWRRIAAIPSKDVDLRNRIRVFWQDLIKECDLKAAEGIERVSGSKNQPLYWLVFAARHERAIEFWEKIRSVSKQRQLDL